MHVHALSYLTDEGEERQSLLASYPLQAAWACLYRRRIAAAPPPGGIRDASTRLPASLGYHSVSMTRPEAALAPILDPAALPMRATGRRTNYAAQSGKRSRLPAQRSAISLKSRSFPTASSGSSIVGSATGEPVGPFKLSACVVHRGNASGGCGSPNKLPFRPTRGGGAIADRPVVMQHAAVPRRRSLHCASALERVVHHRRTKTRRCEPRPRAAGRAGGDVSRGSSGGYASSGGVVVQRVVV